MKNSIEEANPALLCLGESRSHCHFPASIKKMPFPLNNREFVIRRVCAIDANGDTPLASASIEQTVDYGAKLKAVRGVLMSLTRFSPSGNGQCR